MKYLSIFFFFCFFVLLTSQEAIKAPEALDSIVPLQNNKLINEGKLLYFSYDGKSEGDKFVFNSPLIKKIEDAFAQKPYLFTGEVLYFVKKNKADNRKDIEKMLCSVSQLKGLKYYSSSRKKMRLLYKDSYAVKREEEKKGKFKYTKIKDPIDEVFDGLKIFVMQEDLTFGKNVYEFQYFKEDSERAVLISNVNSLYYSIFKAVDEKNVNSYIIVHDLNDYFLVYATVKAEFKKIIGIESKVKSSFMNRLDAMTNWFIAKYNE